MEKIKLNNWDKKVLIFLLVITVIRLAIGGWLGLSDDEAYYWIWSKYLGISYYDHPPVVAYMIRFFTNIFGLTNLAVRMTGTLCITFSSYLVYLIIDKLYSDKKLGYNAVFVLNIVPLFALGGIMTLPDSPLILFYTLSLYVFIKIIYDKNAKLWYLMGILTGLGILSKYNMFLVYPAVFFYLIFDKDERYWFTKKEPYIAFLISTVMISPIFIWNAQHDWVSFAFHLYERQSKTHEIKIHYFIQFVLSQLIIVSPVIFTGFFVSSAKNFKKKDVKLLFFYGFPIFGIFLASSLFNQFKLHWATLSYIPFLIIFMRYSEFSKKAKKIGNVIAITLTLLVYLHLLFFILPIPPKDDITMDMYGWDRVGKEVQQIYNELDKEKWFLFTHRYQLSSQLAFYLPDQDYVYSFATRTEQFDFWRDQNEMIGKNGIYLTTSYYNTKPEKDNIFDKTELIKKIDIVKKGQVYRTYYIYKCFNYQGEK